MYSNIAANKRRTILIMAIFIAFVGLIIWIFDKYLGGSTGVFYGGLIGAFIYVIISYYTGAKLALAVNQAHQIQKADNPRLWRVVENLAITDGLPMPKVYIMNDPAPNAFATGRKPQNSMVCVTSGLLDVMGDQELQGVVAHEMSHIKNYDIRVMLVAFALTVVISLLADIMIRITWFGGEDRDNNNQLFLILGIVAAILAPIVATMIQLAVSRQREYRRQRCSRHTLS
jgi:heat shock protein HtpX